MSPSTGRVQEYLLDYGEPDAGHRHFSHLWPFFPGDALHRLSRGTTPADGEKPRQRQQEDSVEISAGTSAARTTRTWRRRQRGAVAALAKAAHRTVAHKLSEGGGHTGWSCAWAVSLLARFRSPTEAHSALVKLVGTFSVPNLLSTHPKLQPREVQARSGCATCFELASAPRKRNAHGGGAALGAEDKPGSRGLSTKAGDVFQVDGNLGGAAGLAEMLLQSHWHLAPLPGESDGDGKERGRGSTGASATDNYYRNEDWLSNALFGEGRGENGNGTVAPMSPVAGVAEVDLLPALPSDWASGTVTGLRARGGIIVSRIHWTHQKQTTDTSTKETLASLEVELHRPPLSTSTAAGAAFSYGGENAAGSIVSVALAAASVLRVRSPVPLRVASWRVTAPQSIPEGGEGSFQEHHRSAAGAWRRRMAGDDETEASWSPSWSQSSAQWRSRRAFLGAAGSAEAPEQKGEVENGAFGAAYVLDLPPLPHGATISLVFD